MDVSQKIRDKVAILMQGDSAHDLDHVERVYRLALTIARQESLKQDIDFEVLEAACLLHDIGGEAEAKDLSGQTDHAEVSAEMAGPILTELGFSQEKIKHIQNCILSHRYRNDYEPTTIEAQILFDADKLETIGAIGLARSYAWIGRHKAKIYKPADNLEEYVKANLVGGVNNGRIKDKSLHSTQIQYEVKDKYIIDNLHTKTAQEIGQERLTYYKNFLDRLEREVKGEL